jgi:hypothetical protein
MQALDEYFYGTSAHKLAAAAREIGPAAVALAHAIEQYLTHAELLQGLRLPTYRLASSTRWLDRSLRGWLPTLKSMQPSQHGLPVRRANTHARERLFVYRMWCENNRAFRSHKTEAIAELMDIEGFQHQYDARTIERLCAEFTGMNRLEVTQ